MKSRRQSVKRQGFRRFSLGIASMLVSSLFLSGGLVAADEQATAIPTPDASVEETTTLLDSATSFDSTPLESSGKQTSLEEAEVLVADEVQTESANLEIAEPSESSSDTVQASGIGVRTVNSTAAPIVPEELVTAELHDTGIQLAHHADDSNIEPDATTLFAVWTDKKGQDDLVWYRADKDREIMVPFSSHKEYGLYHIHTYLDRKGKWEGINARTLTVEQPKPKVTVERLSEEQYRISVAQVGPTISSVLVPIWSDNHGQDDIVWYQAEKKQDDLFQLTLDTKKHKSEFGIYHVHVYGQSTVTGGLVGLSAESFARRDHRGPAQVTVTDYNENKTDFTVSVVSQAQTKPIKAVRIAFWSEAKGQDDLKWYEPTVTVKGASQRISIANHSNTSDNYIVHVYTDYTDGSTVGTDLGKYKIVKPAEKQVVSTQLTADGIALQLDSTTVKDYSKVRFAVWSDQQGQDDLKWYAADASGKALAHYTNHKGYGIYHIHTYEIQNNQMVGLVGDTLSIAKPEVTAAITPLSSSQYRVKVTNVAPYLTNVTVPVWSDVKGQDDIKWYQTSKKADGSYELVVSINDHGKASGHYSIHLYANSKLEGNRLVGLAATEGFTVADAVTDAKVSVQNHNAKEGTLDVLITSSKDGKTVRSAKVAAWSEAQQANIKWYEGTANNGQLRLSIDERNHQFIKGDYFVHTYVTYDDGTVKGFDLGKYRLEADKPSYKGKLTVSTERLEQGLLDILVSDLSPVKGLSKVLVPIWSEVKGQDDVKWYEASQQADGTYKATALLGSQHGLQDGKYHIHLYYRDDLGQTNFVTSKEIVIQTPEVTGQVKISQLNPVDHTMTVNIDNVAARAGVNTVQVAVWSDANGQDDLQWYQAFREKDGSYQAKIHLSNHKYANGLYHLHTYYTLKNGATKGLAADSTSVSLAAPRHQIVAELNELLREYRTLFANVPGNKAFYISPTDGAEAIFENDQVQPSASTIKLFILAAAYAKELRGEVDLNRRHTVTPAEIVMNSRNLTSAAGQTYSLREIADFMIRTSDNTATNIIIKHLGGVAAVNNEIRRMGYNKTSLNRYMHDDVAINAGVENYISAQESGDLIKNIYNKVAVSASADQSMLTSLANNYWSNWFPSTVKGQALTYDKPGNHPAGIENDVAIIAKNGRAYAVSLLTNANGGDGFTHTGKFGALAQAIYQRLLRRS